MKDASKETLENKEFMHSLKEQLTEVYDDLFENRHKVIVHCAAGIHRAGVIGYILLRWSGLDPK